MTASPFDATQYDLVRAAAREYAPDPYIAATLAPRAVQPDLIALAAFTGDIDRIIATVSQPALAEIRLEWWRLALHAPGNERSGNALADALRGVITRRDLPLAEFDAFLHARAHELYADPVPDDETFAAYLDATDGALLRLAARIVPGAAPDASLVAAATSAIGRVRLLRDYPRLQARGRNPFPPRGSPATPDLKAEILSTYAALAHARGIWRHAPTADRTACLPLGLVAPYLAAMQRPGHDLVRFLPEISPLTRIGRLWAAAALGWV